ncbi:MAG: ABC transporter permease, partial [Lutimonas sp.]
MNYLKNIGKYFIMLGQVFKRPQKATIFRENIFREIEELGLKSLGIVAFISFFVGGVVAIQTGLNVDNPWIPKYLIGFATKRSIILEFAPTFMSI